MKLSLRLCCALVALLSVLAMPALANKSETVRFASFNVSLNGFSADDLVQQLSDPSNAQAKAVAEILQRTRPDVVLLNEFSYVEGGAAIDAFRENFLEVAQGDQQPIDYPYVFIAPSNTGIPSSLDLNNDGSVGGPNDAFGFGFFPGQFGMALLSRYPIAEDYVRTFQNFLWKDMPGALLPDDPATEASADWYSEEELEAFRLSSKSHWDIPIRVGKRFVHVLASHPTPPVFDDPPTFPEGVDFNGRRNHDEIRFWADYVHPNFFRSLYIYDDAGRRGGLFPLSLFVIMGDQNADPFDGDSTDEAILQLTDNRRINTRNTPASPGGVEAAERDGGANDDHVGNPAFDTADFADGAPGNLRVDYVLPVRRLKIVDSGVFWPTSDDPAFDLVGTFPFPSSDHRLVWADVKVRFVNVPLPFAESDESPWADSSTVEHLQPLD